jgi:hypothetical protein
MFDRLDVEIKRHRKIVLNSKKISLANMWVTSELVADVYLFYVFHSIMQVSNCLVTLSDQQDDGSVRSHAARPMNKRTYHSSFRWFIFNQ